MGAPPPFQLCRGTVAITLIGPTLIRAHALASAAVSGVRNSKNQLMLPAPDLHCTHKSTHARQSRQDGCLDSRFQFMMYDKDQGGSIDMDECMQILFRRFGKANLEVGTGAL